MIRLLLDRLKPEMLYLVIRHSQIEGPFNR